MSSLPPPGTRVLARGETWTVHGTIAYEECGAVRLSPQRPASPATLHTLLVPFDRITPLQSAAEPLVVRRARWNHDVVRIAAASRPYGGLAAAPNARITLLPYQLEPALAMLRHGHTRVLIADDVGMGKTIQAGLVLAELARAHDDFRAIVLAPAGLREQWRQELLDRFLLPSVVCDAVWLTKSTRELPPEINPWSLGGIHIASSDLVKRPEVRRSLEDVTWDIAVVDEAHGCTMHTTRLAGVHAIASRARRVLLLTATPPDGDPPQLAALRSIGRLGGEPPIVEFRRTPEHVLHGAATPRRSTMLHVWPSPGERRMHRLVEQYTSVVWKEAGRRADQAARLATLVLRKRALSSAWSLAASVRRRLELLAATPGEPDTTIQLSLPLADEDPLEDAVPDTWLGAPGLADVAHECALLTELQESATAACREESKLRFLLRFIRRAREPVIVFTEYRDTLDHLDRALSGAGHVVARLHGGMSPRERIETQATFERNSTILLATDAASEGLNLHRGCRTVVHFELPWTVSRLRQRTGRVDRFGQQRRVHEVLLVAQHTAERLVLAPLVRRAQLARQSDATADRWFHTLSESAVAAAVMNRGPIELPRGSSTCPSLNLHDEALEEVRRCDTLRALGSDRGHASTRLLLCPSRRPGNAFTVLVAGRLYDSTGGMVHSSLVPLRIACHLNRSPVSDADWRTVARELDDRLRDAWLTRAQNAIHETVAAAAVRYRVVTEGVTQRDAAILDLRTSTPALVQAGLFDARAIQRAIDRRSTNALWAEATAQRSRRTAHAAGVQAVYEIVAIR